jgi:menaquinone-dependent protoporphyrinogen IX oxidase
MPCALVVYDSKTGSTAKMARWAGAALEEKGWAVVTGPMEKAPKIEGMDLVLVGGPLRFGRPSKALAGFVKKNRPALKKTPCAFFLCGISLGIVAREPLPDVGIFIDPGFDPVVYDNKFADLMAYTHTAQHYLKHLLRHTGDIAPLGIGFFRGAMDFARLNAWERLALYFIMIFVKDFEEKDYANPKAVAGWAAEMAGKAARQRG